METTPLIGTVRSWRSYLISAFATVLLLLLSTGFGVSMFLNPLRDCYEFSTFFSMEFAAVVFLLISLIMYPYIMCGPYVICCSVALTISYIGFCGSLTHFHDGECYDQFTTLQEVIYYIVLVTNALFVLALAVGGITMCIMFRSMDSFKLVRREVSS